MSKTEFTAEPGRQDVIMSRVFDAPRDVVFKAVTDPEMVPQWWGPSALTTTVEKMDARPGGMWRYVQRDEEGHEDAFNGVYHMVSPEQLVYTFEWEGMPGHVMLETVRLEEMDGKTKMTVSDVFQTLEERDGALQGDMMEAGATESMDRFAALVEGK